MRSKGQVSLEAYFAVIILLLFFVLVLGIRVQNYAEIDLLEEKFSQNSECRKLAYAMSSVYAIGVYSKLVVELDNNVVISGDEIRVGNNNCFFIGKAKNVELSKGKVAVKNISGELVLENV